MHEMEDRWHTHSLCLCIEKLIGTDSHVETVQLHINVAQLIERL